MNGAEPTWWVLSGYPPFDPGTGDDQGHPDPRQVVRYYRQQKLVTREDGSTHTCRQVDLANMLGVTEGWVRAMETNNKGLDSIARRRVLVMTLSIPPILLGLAPIGDITSQDGKLEVTASTLKWLQDSLAECWELYYTSTPYNIQESVDCKIDYLDVFSSVSDDHLRNQLITLQVRFYHLAARIASDQTQFADAYSCLKKATRLAEKLDSHELLAASYFWRGRAYLEQVRNNAAVTALNKAQSYVDNGKVPIPLQGAILLEGALAHAYTTEPIGSPKYEQDKQKVLDMFARAKPLIQQSPENDSNFVRVNLGRYYHFKSEAYIALGMPEDALRTLDLADTYTAPHFTRRKAYINILRANASLDGGAYPDAANYALDALKMCKSIDSGVNLDFLKSITIALSQSPYGTSEAVGRLQVGLMNL